MSLETALALLTAVAQLGMGAGAWRLANQLKARVDDHEARLTHQEKRLVLVGLK